MKKIIAIFAAIFMLAFSTVAQTTVNVNDSTMGHVEKYPAWVNVIQDSAINSIDTVYFFDTVNVAYDTIGGIVDTIYTIDTVSEVDTSYYAIYDTVWAENAYDYLAVANDGYSFVRWEIITTYNIWATSAGTFDSIWYDTIVMYDCDTIDSTVYCAEGWLMLDGGIPDVDPSDSLGIDAINITAYFEQDTTSLAIAPVDEIKYNVYPNPTTDIVTIDGDFDYLLIYDARGRQLYRGTYNCFDMRLLKNGAYFMVLVKDNNKKTVTVIKQ